MRSISNEVHANANDALTDWLVADRHKREREERSEKIEEDESGFTELTKGA